MMRRHQHIRAQPPFPRSHEMRLGGGFNIGSQQKRVLPGPYPQNTRPVIVTPMTIFWMDEAEDHPVPPPVLPRPARLTAPTPPVRIRIGVDHGRCPAAVIPVSMTYHQDIQMTGASIPEIGHDHGPPGAEPARIPRPRVEYQRVAVGSHHRGQAFPDIQHRQLEGSVFWCWRPP